MTTRRATIEWEPTGRMAGCMRVGGPGFDHEKYDDWDRAATVFRKGTVAVVIGWRGRITPSMRRAMAQCLAREGFAVAEYEHRRPDGSKPTELIDLTHYRTESKQ